MGEAWLPTLSVPSGSWGWEEHANCKRRRGPSRRALLWAGRASPVHLPPPLQGAPLALWGCQDCRAPVREAFASAVLPCAWWLVSVCGVPSLYTCSMDKKAGACQQHWVGGQVCLPGPGLSWGPLCVRIGAGILGNY